jgi:hypothetical protein
MHNDSVFSPKAGLSTGACTRREDSTLALVWAAARIQTLNTLIELSDSLTQQEIGSPKHLKRQS